jgi:DNA-binding protein H-NS
MARMNGFDKMSHAELLDLRGEIDRLIAEKQVAERAALKQRLADIAKAQGFALEDIVGKGRKLRGAVPVKYRDPKNPENTWTGRGRMPRWLVAATKTRGVKKDDFLI